MILAYSLYFLIKIFSQWCTNLQGNLMYAMILYNMFFSRRVFLPLLVVMFYTILDFPVNPASATEVYQENCNYSMVWREINTTHFAILYSSKNFNLAQEIRGFYSSDLDEIYEDFSSAFGEDLVTPITIRIYPSENDYYCLNALVPSLRHGNTHSHIGAREISLIAENITPEIDAWHSQAMNGFRHELVVLFAEHISNGNAPQGLLDGLGGYAEDPNETFEDLYLASERIENPTLNWLSLWEGDERLSSDSAYLQTICTVAYLIDVYGWEYFVLFLRNLSESEGYRQILDKTYGLDILSLQEHWEDYFRVYLTGRWRTNVFHDFDLSVFEELIKAGAYSDAAEGLEDALPLIENFGDDEAYSFAQDLFAKSQLGIEAGAVASQARQAIVFGEFEKGIELSNQALDLYAQLGDNRKNEELENFLAISNEVLELRKEVASIEGDIINPIVPKRLANIGERLSELGDQQGFSLVNVALAAIISGQRLVLNCFSFIGILIVGFLLWRRVRSVKQSAPPESDLL